METYMKKVIIKLLYMKHNILVQKDKPYSDIAHWHARIHKTCSEQI